MPATVDEHSHGGSMQEREMHMRNGWWSIVVGGMVGMLLAAGVAVQAADFPGDGVTGPALRYHTQGRPGQGFQHAVDLGGEGHGKRYPWREPDVHMERHWERAGWHGVHGLSRHPQQQV